MIWVDAHCHLDFEAFDFDRKQVVMQAQALGVVAAALPGVSVSQWQRRDEVMQALQREVPSWRWANQYGIHPYHITEHDQSALDALEASLKAEPEALVGEIGLDNIVVPLSDMQRFFFEHQLILAKSLDRPVVLHVCKAHEQVFNCLKRVGFVQGGMVHAFTGSVELAERYLKMGFKISIGGAVSFPGAKKLHKAVFELDLQDLLLETDDPDRAPTFVREAALNKTAENLEVMNRHKVRNSPEYLPKIGQFVADLKGVSVNEVARATTANAQSLFGAKLAFNSQ